MKFTINNVSDEDLSLSLIAYPSEYAEIELPEKVEAGKMAEGKLKIREDKLDESFEKSFTFELGDEEATRFTLPIKRTVKKPIIQPAE